MSYSNFIEKTLPTCTCKMVMVLECPLLCDFDTQKSSLFIWVNVKSNWSLWTPQSSPLSSPGLSKSKFHTITTSTSVTHTQHSLVSVKVVVGTTNKGIFCWLTFYLTNKRNTVTKAAFFCGNSGITEYTAYLFPKEYNNCMPIPSNLKTFPKECYSSYSE